MAIFLTGSTGYIGAHVAARAAGGHSDRLNLLVRAKDEHEAEVRLWKSLQLHFPIFRNSTNTCGRGSASFAAT